jgi:hypothetical protein
MCYLVSNCHLSNQRISLREVVEYVRQTASTKQWYLRQTGNATVDGRQATEELALSTREQSR